MSLQIYRVMVKLNGDMSRLHHKLKADDIQRVGARAVLCIHQSGRLQVSLIFPDKTDFAQLNNHHARVFDEILQIPSIEMEAFVDLVTFKQTIEKASKANEATMRVNMNVYGRREEVEAIGKLLSNEKIFLQDPDHPRAGLDYINPHLFDAPEAGCIPGQDVISTRVSESQAEDSKSSFHEAVNDIYASLKRGTDLELIGGDARLRTELLP
jgi:SWI/SNF-related matrix-associated actin-dependent regulator of chromatin subfamily A3